MGARPEARPNNRVFAIAIGGCLGLAVAFGIWGRSSTREVAVRSRAGMSSPPRQDEAPAGSRASPAAVPDIARVNPSLAEQIADPGSPKYDPVRLMMATSPKEVFLREPRYEPWAAKMETHLLQRARQDLLRVPGVSDLSVECRMTGCKVQWNAVDKTSNFNAGNLMVALYRSGGGGRLPSGRVAFFHGPTFAGVDPKSPEQLIRRLEELRASALKEQRARYQQGKPKYPKMPLELWPEE
jgi:hypothetical protein